MYSARVAYLAIVRKEVTRFMRIWVQTLIPPAITMSLYFLIFGSLIGRRIGEMDGQPYMSFVVPGLIMMAVINNSYGNVASSFFASKFQKYIEELLVSPTPSVIILLGYVTGAVLRGILVAIIVTILSLFFTDLSVHSWGITLSVVLLSSTLFALAGLINGIYANSFDDISVIPTFILTPMTYLGGVFYSISLLPDFWKTVSLFNPILYLVNVFRYGMLGVSDVNVSFALAGITVLVIAAFFFCLYLLEKGPGLRS
jgi:ABC-2 type transport system permease protein